MEALAVISPEEGLDSQIHFNTLMSAGIVPLDILIICTHASAGVFSVLAGACTHRNTQ